jgi:hypothetical protein
MQEQQKMIENQQMLIEELKAQNQQLLLRIEKLETK